MAGALLTGVTVAGTGDEKTLAVTIVTELLLLPDELNGALLVTTVVGVDFTVEDAGISLGTVGTFFSVFGVGVDVALTKTCAWGLVCIVELGTDGAALGLPTRLATAFDVMTGVTGFASSLLSANLASLNAAIVGAGDFEFEMAVVATELVASPKTGGDDPVLGLKSSIIIIGLSSDVGDDLGCGRITPICFWCELGLGDFLSPKLNATEVPSLRMLSKADLEMVLMPRPTLSVSSES